MNKPIRLKVSRKTRMAATPDTGEPADADTGFHQSHSPTNDLCAMSKKTVEVNLPSALHHDGVDERTCLRTPGFSLDDPTQFAGCSHRMDYAWG